MVSVNCIGCISAKRVRHTGARFSYSLLTLTILFLCFSFRCDRPTPTGIDLDVNFTGTPEGQTVTWNTSLSGMDTSNGSCELFYVSYVRIETKVYE